MFKYGSFKMFVLKVSVGIITVFFSSFYITSLLTYNEGDPGFNTFSTNMNEYEIKNYFGFLGAQLSSYSIVILGILSYIICFFILFEGIKCLFGIKNKHLTIRFFSNLLGVLLLSIFLVLFDFREINFGLIAVFFSELLNQNLFQNLENKAVNILIKIFILISGIALIILSFSIKLKTIISILKIFKIIKFFKYINIFSVLYKFLKNRPKNNFLKNKNEPTINKQSIYSIKKSPTLKKRVPEQLEINQLKFSLPKKNILNKSSYKGSALKELNKTNNELANKLEKTLFEYGVEGKVIGYKTGPIVTLFEFVPSAGIKSSKIIGLSDDIARAMSSISSRISSQPGKTSLGIEIPNQKRESVLFGDLVDDEKFEDNINSLRLALGKDISGEKIFTDLEKMPHLLIAGTTGSGKSVGINTMILSLLYRFKPNECKLILIDPKMLELSIYEDIPHLLTPVVTDPKKAVFALKWVVREMENRYKLMSSVNVKNISSYNNKVLKTISSGRKLYREVQTGIDPDTRIPIIEKREIILEKMPFIVVVIDEMADLMMVAGKEVEALVQRLAQMARASGIHLITATQRPSVDVITGTIKANFPSRISYKVASKFDSRTILNEMGAEQLLGSGDMLFLENGANIKRLHGGFVSESEVETVVSYIKGQATFDYRKEISLENIDIPKNKSDDLITDNNDELYTKAVDIIVKQQKVSTSYIQRYLQIGYNRAARIVEKMEEDGIISQANNAGKRHVLKKE